MCEKFRCIFHQHLTMEKQIPFIVRSCHHQIFNIGCIRHYLTNGACKTLVNAFVTSKLVFGNGQYPGTGEKLDRLQRVQKTAARRVTRSRKQERIIISDSGETLQVFHQLPTQIQDFNPYMYILLFPKICASIHRKSFSK